MVKELDEKAIAELAVIESPEYTQGNEGFEVVEGECERVKDEHAPNGFEHVEHVHGDNERYGRVFSKGLAVAFKASTKEKLDSDIKDTLGEQMGLVFGAISKVPHGRLIVSGFMFLSIVPVLGVIGVKMWEGFKNIKEVVE